MSHYTSPREDFISALFGKPFEALTCKEICEKLGAISESSTQWKLPVRAKAVALLYLASEFRGVNWSRGELKNVCARVGVDFGVVMETIWRIEKKLGVRTTKPGVSRVVYELADRLKLPESVKSRAAELARGLVESRLTPGKGIYGIAAAAVYVAAREVGIRLRGVDVAEVAGVSEVTVRARLRDLKKALHLTGSY